MKLILVHVPSQLAISYVISLLQYFIEKLFIQGT